MVNKTKFLAVLLLVVLGFTTSSFAQARGISINLKDASLEQLILQAEEQSDYKFYYESHSVNVSQKVSVNVKDASINKLMDSALVGTDVTYSVSGNKVMLAPKTESSREGQSQKLIKGVVLDSKGQPIAGADVVIVGTTKGTSTDANGAFFIDAKAVDKLKVSFLGFVDKTVTATVESLNITLEDDYTALSEVVVIGYGTAKKSSLTGALTQVNNESFQDQRVTRVDQALQGRAAGVQVSNTVGAPGGNVKIRIRGANSILGDNSPLFVIDGFVGADFNALNPNDIKSIEVLKDASSTAIYGSRGANGVVLVTTKTGNSNGKVSITYSGSATASKIIKNYDLLSAGQYAEQINAHNTALGEKETFTQSQIDDYYANGGFDYLKEVLRTAISHQHQLSISGGSNNMSYWVSGSYLNQQGIIKKSGYDRYNLRTNFNIKATDKLSFRFSINDVYSNGKNNEVTAGASTILNQALAWAPTTNPYNDDGTYRAADPVGSIKTNPLSLLYDSENTVKNNFFTVLGGASFVIIPGLTADFQAVGDFTNSTTNLWSGQYASLGNPTASVAKTEAKTIQTTSQLTYHKTFGLNDIDAVAVVETQYYDYNLLQGSATGLNFPSLKYDNLAQATTNKATTNYSMWTLLSYIGRINYSYDNKYLASASVRRDGSSKFTDGNKYSVFPAFAVAWNAGDESFIKDLGFINHLKFRASWGRTGSQAISPYATKSGFSNVTYAFTTGTETNGIQAGNPSNPDLTWETTTQKDLGFELSVLDNRLSLEADYYIKDTKDLLLNKPVPAYQGGGSIASNIGSVNNKGIDLSLTGKILDTKDMSLSSTVNFSYIKNKVTSLGDNDAVYMESGLTGISDGFYDFVYKVGKPLGSIWGLKYMGPWQKSEAVEAAKFGCVPGDAHYQDRDGNHVIDGSDYQIIGCGMPKYSLGWNTSYRYKKLSVNMFFQGVFGVDKLDYNRCIFMMASRDVKGATFAEILDRYIPGKQENAWLPSWSPTSTWKPTSTLFLENGNYLRLKNISVSYDFTIPKIGDCTVSLNGINLLTFTKYKGIDPEASNGGGGTSDLIQSADYGAYPNSKSITLGLDLRF